ncbi:MAG: hypothetical protein HQL57_09590 [Magnetococcales bacterium]|nr:hypothetical protein [Magnetococcales bacterium]MBF0157422.1 hypothetical protein [Magnetococcales bacterium]
MILSGRWYPGYAFLALLGFLLLGWTLAWALAAVEEIPAAKVLAVLDDPDQSRPPSPARVEVAIAALTRSAILVPANADLFLTLGRLEQARGRGLSPWSRPARLAFSRSLEHYRRATRIRPSWGYGWVNLALAELQAGGSEGEVIAHLERAMVLAPWEPPVQRLACQLGLMLLERLDPAHRRMVIDLFGRTLARQPEFLVPLLVSRRQESLIGPFLRENRRAQELVEAGVKSRKER